MLTIALGLDRTLGELREDAVDVLFFNERMAKLQPAEGAELARGIVNRSTAITFWLSAPKGEAAVETLAIGDEVLTATGQWGR